MVIKGDSTLNSSTGANAASRPAGIKDVAAKAGVSLKTVTNVVHGRPNVSPQTRSRVEQAISDLQYRPSRVGRQLQSGRSQMITLAVPRIDEPYLGSLAHAIIAAAEVRGYTVVLDETLGRLDREQRAADGYPGHGIDGVIFSPLALDPTSIATGSWATPTVLLGSAIAGSAADYVAIDNPQSAHDVVDHLVETGRSRFAFLGRDQGVGLGRSRLKAVRNRLHEHSLEEPVVLRAQSFSRESGRLLTMTESVPWHDIDALICASDLLAIGAMAGLRDLGVSVPDQVAVTGWDNIVDCQYVSPTLTSVGPDLAALATTTVDSLIRRIEGHTGVGETLVVPHSLHLRASSHAVTQ